MNILKNEVTMLDTVRETRSRHSLAVSPGTNPALTEATHPGAAE
jgi:hypothetical protein